MARRHDLEDGHEWRDEEEAGWWPPEVAGRDAGEATQLPGGPGGDSAPRHPTEENSPPSEPPGRDEASAPATGDEIFEAFGAPLVPRKRRGRRTVRRVDKLGRPKLDGRQRLLLLDAWLRSKLPAKDFAGLVGISPHTLYKWKKLFEQEGPAGLASKPKGRPSDKASRLPRETQRAIVMLKDAHPDWGQDRIHHVLKRTEGFTASPGAIGRVLADAGYVVEDVPTHRHRDKVRRFERARPNELWQTDLFTFVLKREGRRVHLVGYMDDHSRFLVGFGLHASSSGALVREVFEASIANFGAPTEVLTDNGAQYHTWRGKSAFTALCERRGIRQIVARPRRPQTLGKIERFWGTLWRECVESAVFRGIDDARVRIGHFIDHYNFQRPHSGIGGLVPADRYFAAADEVRATLEARVQANALDLARHGEPRKPFYLTGRVGNTGISLHAEGERVVLVREDGSREEVDLGATGRRCDDEADQERDVQTDVQPDESEATEGTDAHETDSESDELEGPTESPEPPPPATRDTSPADPCWAQDDTQELAPGQSKLDGIFARLKRRWHDKAGPASDAPAEKEDEA